MSAKGYRECDGVILSREVEDYQMIRDGRKLRAPEIDAWLDCGTPETLLSTNSYLLAGRHHNHGEVVNSVLIEPVHIENGAVVRDSVLGPNVSVAKGSIVEASILEDAIINRDSLVKRMVLNNSILGGSVHLVGSSRRMNIGDDASLSRTGNMTAAVRAPQCIGNLPAPAA